MDIQTVDPLRNSRATQATSRQPRPAAALRGNCREQSAFQYWQDETLAPCSDAVLDFSDLVSIPAGKRAVIELVTGTIQVPAGQSAHLRMSTSLECAPSELDLAVIPQHALGCACVLMVSQTMREYTDGEIAFQVTRERCEGAGYALICISGHFVEA